MSAPASRSASPPRSAPTKRKREPRPPATHPPYIEMIRTAIATLKERGGSSRQKILQYIQSNYDVGTEQSLISSRLRNALRSGVEKGVLLRSAKGKGANGSFRVGKALPKKKPRARSPKRKGARQGRKRSPRKKARRTGSTKKPRRSAKKPRKSRKSPTKRRSPKKRTKSKARRAKPKARARR